MVTISIDLMNEEATAALLKITKQKELNPTKSYSLSELSKILNHKELSGEFVNAAQKIVIDKTGVTFNRLSIYQMKVERYIAIFALFKEADLGLSISKISAYLKQLQELNDRGAKSELGAVLSRFNLELNSSTDFVPLLTNIGLANYIVEGEGDLWGSQIQAQKLAYCNGLPQLIDFFFVAGALSYRAYNNSLQVSSLNVLQKTMQGLQILMSSTTARQE